ncbi:hypothetical protein CCP2SC5_320017 [Azospirillaceae bacterium]
MRKFFFQNDSERASNHAAPNTEASGLTRISHDTSHTMNAATMNKLWNGGR